MKRYLYATTIKSPKSLANALYSVIQSTLGMGESIDDIADYLAELANYEYDYDDTSMEDVCVAALTLLVKSKSSALVDFIDEYFTDDILVNMILTQCQHDSKLVKSIKLVYSVMQSFPNRDELCTHIKTNVLNQLNIDGWGVVDLLSVVDIGSAIAHTYWKYVSAEEYGKQSADKFTIGDAHSDGVYVYSFVKQISPEFTRDASLDSTSYIFSNVWVSFKVRPDATSAAVIDACIGGHASLDQYPEFSEVIKSWKVANSDKQTIDSVARDIASWLDTNVSSIINQGIALYSGNM